jgi:hypothetical protein
VRLSGILCLAEHFGTPGAKISVYEPSAGSCRYCAQVYLPLVWAVAHHGLLAAKPLSALDNHINVLRFQFHPSANALGQFPGCQGSAASQERLVNQFAPFRVFQNRPAHELDRFLRRVIKFLLVAAPIMNLGWQNPKP